MSDNFAFDKRIAHDYDKHRAHPPTVSAQIGHQITSLLESQAHILELGIGTGRIAKPVAQAGGLITGFDLSLDMLHELQASLHSSKNGIPVVQADMQAMPFASHTFDAVLVVHVLHLAKNIEAVLREVVRVLQPDGVILQGEDWIDPDSVVGQLRHELRRLVLENAPHFRPPGLAKSREDILLELGAAQTVEYIAAEWTVSLSPAERLEAIAAKTDPESWILPQDLFEKVLEGLHTYAAATWASLEEPQSVTRRFALKITSGQWANAAV